MNRRNLLLAATLLAATLPLVIIGCSGKPTGTDNDPWANSGSKPKVVVSFAPLYCFAANVAGDDAVVKNVMTTTGPHDFDPTDNDIRLVTKADIMFIVGLGLDERQAEKMKTGSGNSKLKLIELAEKLLARKPIGVPTDLPATTDPAAVRALADLSLAVFNTNEFVYVP